MTNCGTTTALFFGCEGATNNTGELSAMCALFTWVLGLPGSGPLTVHYDSEYAANIIQGWWVPKANFTTARYGQELLRKIRFARLVHFQHHYSHIGVWGNERADLNADEG